MITNARPQLRLVKSDLASQFVADENKDSSRKQEAIHACVKEIDRIHEALRRLSLETRVEAMKAGLGNPAFESIGSEMNALSQRTLRVASLLAAINEAPVKGQSQLELITYSELTGPRRA